MLYKCFVFTGMVLAVIGLLWRGRESGRDAVWMRRCSVMFSVIWTPHPPPPLPGVRADRIIHYCSPDSPRNDPGSYLPSF